eukprot:6889867-Pyramimonas_sp.AAC.1
MPPRAILRHGTAYGPTTCRSTCRPADAPCASTWFTSSPTPAWRSRTTASASPRRASEYAHASRTPGT